MMKVNIYMNYIIIHFNPYMLIQGTCTHNAFHLQYHSYYTEHTLLSTGILLNISVSMARGNTSILNCASNDLLRRETHNFMYYSVSNCSLNLIYVLSFGFESHT